MKAIILAAGYATRLYPLTLDTPKPLLKIGEKLIIEHILENLSQIQELTQILIVTNHKFKPKFDSWLKTYQKEEAAKFTKPIKILDDNTTSNEDRLGAIGDIKFALTKEKIDEDLLIVAGDNLFSFPLTELVSFQKEKNKSIITLCDLKNPARVAKKYGVVTKDSSQKLLSFEEKPEHPKTALAATAIYLLKKDAVAELKNSTPNQDNLGEFIKHLLKSKDIYCYTLKDSWYDIGSKDELNKADIRYGGKGEY